MSLFRLVPLLFMLAALGASTAGAQIVPSGRVTPTGAPVLPARIDMGRGPWLPGSYICGSEDRNNWYGWFDGMVRDGLRRPCGDPLLCDFVEGSDATFVVAVEPDTGVYQLHVILGDTGKSRGPVRVRVGDAVMADSVSTAAGESRTITFETRPVAGRLEIRVQALSCTGFAVNGVEISGPSESWLDQLFPEQVNYPPIPDPATLPNMKRADRLKLLGTICDFLVKTEPRDGCFSYHGAWYQNAYPIRTLMAGARLLNRPDYAERALGCLDRFVDLQEPDGNWYSGYFGTAACDGITPADSTTANLADVGTMTLCLAALVPDVSPERRERYIRAARTYADSVSLPNQMMEGPFPNLLWAGQYFSHPYTVATATQCASLAALYLVTGETRFLAAAETGVRWMNWGTFLEDGRLVLHPYNQDAPVVKESTHFGEVFYVAEALLWVRRATPDKELRAEIDRTLDRWIFGSEGLKAKTVHGYWWPPMDTWNSSKMGGVLYVLADHHRRADPEIATWLNRGLAWMADAERASSIGVLAHPASSRGAFALVATGFAGVGVAASIDPAVLYPAPIATSGR